MQVRERLSPNFNDRPDGAAIDLIVLHYTGMQSTEAALDRLCDPAAKVSSHYLIDERGQITRLVPDEKRAWHAGVSNWMGRDNLNDCSIGIEIANGGHDFGSPPYPQMQILSVIGLCHDLMARHSIPAKRVLGHSDIAPARKEDPGEWFPWETLAAAGIGSWVAPAPIEEGPELREGDRGETVSELQYRLATLGYGLEVLGVYDAQTIAVVTAFQRHFRPVKVDGVADVSTIATLARLLSCVK